MPMTVPLNCVRTYAARSCRAPIASSVTNAFTPFASNSGIYFAPSFLAVLIAKNNTSSGCHSLFNSLLSISKRRMSKSSLPTTRNRLPITFLISDNFISLNFCECKSTAFLRNMQVFECFFHFHVSFYLHDSKKSCIFAPQIIINLYNHE